ncbi:MULTISPECIES: transketolase [Pseudomonas]|uniref:transketolase n=1 Tax=Pseudomonas TaxID=286 RepID=UPI000C0713FD|nr:MULTISPECIES: transketolase [Pseudomonas]MCD5991190.1 transketolase [Pseudomonas quasicaspiana]MDU8358306.1 transketolase [Pseudomonas syringae group sp. J309-1]PHN32314.1 transketolase [Pseudomonas sp. ICMP 561]
MLGISESAVWVKTPSPEVGVVIVTRAGLPGYISERLRSAIDDWDQVGYLHVREPNEFLEDWLRAESSQAALNLDTRCHASQLLRSVSKGCYLLDIEESPSPQLTWLGSVCGHKLHVVRLGESDFSAEAMDQQVEEILAKVSTLAKSILEERFIGV